MQRARNRAKTALPDPRFSGFRGVSELPRGAEHDRLKAEALKGCSTREP